MEYDPRHCFHQSLSTESQHLSSSKQCIEQWATHCRAYAPYSRTLEANDPILARHGLKSRYHRSAEMATRIYN